MKFAKNLPLTDTPSPLYLNGTSIINYTNQYNEPYQLVATDPKKVLITKNQTDFNKIKPIINASLESNKLWVAATSYEWGVAQLGLNTAHAHAIFIEYDQFEFKPAIPYERLSTPLPPLQLAPQWTHRQFQAAVDQAKSAIKEGDIYQINLSYPSHVLGDISIESIYDAIFKHQMPPHGAFINTDFCKIASCSPEEFFYFKDGHIRSRPIKGTIGRHSDPIKDQLAFEHLKSSKKDFAELTMITDLMRNDLSMCAKQGSVNTPTLCDIVPFNYVYHLMSTVEAETKPSLTPLEILSQLAPGGSITGCPKHSACQMIEMIEAAPRHFYTGHIGFMHGTQEAAFNVAIRSCYQYPSSPIITHSGCGITIDSIPELEYQESLDKLRFITDYITQ